MFPELRARPYKERIKQLNLWTLEERRNRADLIEVYKMHRGLSKLPFDAFFEMDTSRCTRGHSLKLVKHRFKTELRQHFFSERVINRWNSLDDDSVLAPSLNAFKWRLTTLRSWVYSWTEVRLTLWLTGLDPVATPGEIPGESIGSTGINMDVV